MLGKTLVATVMLVAATAGAQVAGGALEGMAQAGPDQRVECTSPAGAPVTLDGSASRGNGTNDSLSSYEWFERYNASGQTLLATGAVAHVTLPLGTHVVTLRVTNATNETDTDDVVVEIVDTVAPTIEATPSVTTIGPPNHKLASVHVDVRVHDACDAHPGFVLSAVSSDEADDGTGDGHTTGDVQGASLGTPDADVQLRAERAGPGDGRAYALTYTTRDASGNAASAVVTIGVPHG
jgi:hypothetical protein